MEHKLTVISKLVDCPNCQGSGRMKGWQQLGTLLSQLIEPCTECKGSGKVTIEISRIHIRDSET